MGLLAVASGRGSALRSLGHAAFRHATGHGAAVCGPSRPGPLHSPLARCSEPTKLDRFWLEFSAQIPWLGGAESDEGLEVSDAQKAFILKQGSDGMPVADICRKAGISQATYFNWKRKYDGLLPTEMRRLKQLEDENSKLRKVVVDLSLDKEMLQDVIRRKL